MKRERPKVGIIYSGGPNVSLESQHFSQYIAAHLAATGWCTVCLIPFFPGNIPDLPNSRIKYYPINSSQPIDAPTSDITYGHWYELSACHVYITCVNIDESDACGRKIFEMVPGNLAVTIFAMQRGVRGTSEFKEILSAKKDFTVIECVVGFAVVPHPITGALISTTHSVGNTIIIERLTKEMVKTSDGPVNLLETLPFTFIFQKTLTTSCWGVLLYETIFALQTLLHEEELFHKPHSTSYSFDTIAKCLSNRNVRIIYAAMIREGHEILVKSAGAGAWRPDLRAISRSLTLWRLEMLLVLPSPFFQLFSSLLGFPLPTLPSPDIIDRKFNRDFCIGNQLNELIENSVKHNQELKVISFIHSKLEIDQKTKITISSNGIQNDLKNLIGSSQSVAEALYWGVRIAGVFSFLLVAYFLLFH